MKKLELNQKQSALFTEVMGFHAGQVRKYTGEPYHQHLLEVAEIVFNYIESPGLMIEVALCHDLFEDTVCDRLMLAGVLRKIGYESIEAKAILEGVTALTDIYTFIDYPNQNRKVRKEMEAERLGDIEPDFQTVKYADLLSNTQSIVQYDPSFAKVYLAEKRRILHFARKGDLDLFHKVYTQLVWSEQQVRMGLYPLNAKDRGM